MSNRANVLGDIRAEADQTMLDCAFYETPDYRTLIECADRTIVVGRRGTGKSAMAYMLGKHFCNSARTIVVNLAADEDQIIGIRPLIKLFGENFKLIRAGSRVAWRYAFLMEISEALSKKYKYKSSNGSELLDVHLLRWKKNQYGFSGKLKDTLRSVIDPNDSPECRVSDLAQNLNLRDVENAVNDVLIQANLNVVVLVDRLDEGYEPDDVGIGLVDGIVQAIIDINTKFEKIKPVIFLRDNIFRAVAKYDPDFSRNIEGQVLRIHWDEYGLFNLVANRLKSAFDLDLENSLKIWNRCVSRGLTGKEGFKCCLRLTLYRPRDLLILLNDAFYNANKQERKQIIEDDIESSAKIISNNRLDDLFKEYPTTLPGLKIIASSFHNRMPEINIEEASSIISSVISKDNYDQEIQKYFALFNDPINIVRDLYSVGFIGIYDEKSGNYIFCHDGRDPNKEIEKGLKILIHPCYWMALNLQRNSLNPEEAEDIYDEYDIEISSDNPEQRKKRLGQIINELDSIQVGREGFSEFEDWCLQAIKIVFAGSLRNIEHHPNKDAVQRRDVVATNLCESRVWKRIYEDYKSRQIIFEIKNFENIGGDEYRQMLSYLTGDYGKFGIIINRDDDHMLKKGKELEWFREMYSSHKIIVIKITGKYLCDLLSKLRNPQKHDIPDKSLNKLLDTYTRLYVSGKTSNEKIRRNK